jgi:hypothetical protein
MGYWVYSPEQPWYGDEPDPHCELCGLEGVRGLCPACEAEVDYEYWHSVESEQREEE